jgi:hypothetical protein
MPLPQKKESTSSEKAEGTIAGSWPFDNCGSRSLPTLVVAMKPVIMWASTIEAVS